MHPLLKRKPLVLPFIFGFILLLIASLLFLPGTSGGFVLDDFGVLPGLYTSIELQGFWYAVFNGETGPTGRPISLLTFALQQASWPQPENFKYVNVIIHLMNSVLIALIVRRIMRLLLPGAKDTHRYAAIVIAFVWAILPMQISTVLYVVQRMVLLSSFFTLLGIWAYLAGRQCWLSGNLSSAKWLLIVGVGSALVLGVLAKESGLLLAAYLLSIDVLYQQRDPISSRWYRAWTYVFLYLPILAFFAYIFRDIHVLTVASYELRAFSFYERLITQPLILWEYIQQILLPRASSLGLYHDDYLHSKSLMEPVKTLWAIVAWVVVITSGIMLRKTLPILLFTVLWFLSGHLMESTFISLELYFEHRNYLACLAIIVAVYVAAHWLWKKIEKIWVKYLLGTLMSAWIVLLCAITYSQTTVWGNPIDYAITQAKEHPGSLRARILEVEIYKQYRYEQGLIDSFKKLQKDFPDVAVVQFYDIQLACFGIVELPDGHDKYTAFTNAKFGYGVIKAISDVLTLKEDGHCSNVSTEYFRSVIDALLENPAFEIRHNTLAFYKSMTYLLQGNLQEAIHAMELSRHLDFEDGVHLVRLYAANQQLNEAMQLLARLEKKTKNTLIGREQRKQLDDIRTAIQEELDRQ